MDNTSRVFNGMEMNGVINGKRVVKLGEARFYTNKDCPQINTDV